MSKTKTTSSTGFTFFLVLGSDLEKSDLKKAYVNGGGCINYIMEHVPFMGVEDEPRFHKIIKEWIDSKEVEDLKAFTNEPKAKKDRRHKKYARESKEAEKIKEKLKTKNDDNDLAKQIAIRQEQRGKASETFFDKLMAKYANEDDDDDVTLKELGKRSQKGKKKSAPGSVKKETPIKGGRVSKRNK